MGTSSSSTGPSGKTPLVPSWIDELIPSTVPEQSPLSSPNSLPKTPPARRFSMARRDLGEYAKSGDKDALRRGLRSYVGSGLGGAVTGTRRFLPTVSAAGQLFSLLNGARNGGSISGGNSSPSSTVQTAAQSVDFAELRGKNLNEIASTIADAICPNGTIDEELIRDGLFWAVADLLEKYPDTDIDTLTDEQITEMLGNFVGIEIYQRIQIDIGKNIVEKASNPEVAYHRQVEIRDYVLEVSNDTMEKRIQDGEWSLSAESLENEIQQIIQETLTIFEDYIG